MNALIRTVLINYFEGPTLMGPFFLGGFWLIRLFLIVVGLQRNNLISIL